MDVVGGFVLAIFIGTYLAISTEKVNRTATALLGLGLVGIVLWSASTEFNVLVEHIEWQIVLFVTAMMIIVTVASGSGMFQFLAIEIAKPTHADTKQLYIAFLSFVFVISLVLDTTSTMLIMAPLTIELCKSLDIDFKPFLISEAVVCNFASIPSIVGAVPNLVIAEETVIDQGLLFITLMPLSIILFLISLPILLRYFDAVLSVPSAEEVVDEILLLDPHHMIRSKRDFYASIIAILVLVVSFTIGHSIGFAPSMVAIIVASFLLLISREWVDDILKKVNWGTIFFLIGLFGLVAALGITGIIDEIGIAIGALIGDDKLVAIVFMIWVPGLLSAVIDNIPISAVVAPIANLFAPISPLLPIALIFGVNVGGFILPIGSPANILAMAFAEKEHDRISMSEFAKIATPLGFLMLGVGTIWLMLMSLIF